MMRFPSWPTGLLAAICLLTVNTVFANGGHDHGPPPAPTAAPALEPRLEASSPDVELLAIPRDDGSLGIYLDRYASNEPIDGARLTVDVNNQTLTATPVETGLYRLDGVPGLSAPGHHELVFTIEAGTFNDILIGTLIVPEKTETAANGTMATTIDYLLLAGAAVVGLLAGLALSRRRTAPLIVGLLAISAAPGTLAHEGHDHGDEKAPATIAPSGNAPMRLPDGSLFVPKPVQRLLAIRTTLAEVRDTPMALELNGHLVADPNRSGRVQAAQGGRVEPTPQGLPHLGQTVRAGQVLAYLMPLAATLESANQQAQLAELNSQINLTEKRLARLQQLTGSVAQRDIDEARAELDGLRKRRAAVGGGLSLREPLRAPVDGVISAAFAVAGQVVEARETLFEVINPRQWWVEAIVYDAGLSERISSAIAQTFDGKQVLSLRLLGMGYQRRSQGLPLHFSITGEVADLSAGQPVRILAQTRATVRGVPVPRDSVIRGGGDSRVWVHTGAERFTSKPVRVQAVDGLTLVVTEGLNAGERVVTQGAALLAQVR